MGLGRGQSIRGSSLTSSVREAHKRYIERKYGPDPETELDEFVRGIVGALMGTDQIDPTTERTYRIEERIDAETENQ